MAKVNQPVQPTVPPTPPKMDDQPSKLENIISVILGLAVVLVIGAMIVNTIRSRQKEQAAIKPAQVQTEPVTPTPSGTYTVQAGDTLWSIAVKSYNDGYKWPEIQKANNLKDASVIEKGTQLIIPSVSPMANTAPATQEQVGSTGPTGGATGAIGTTGPTGGAEEVGQTLSTSTDREYTVVRGDNLWNIAVRHYGNGYRWVDIAKANNLHNPRIIHAGNVLTLPV